MAALAQRRVRLEELEKENADLREQVERLQAQLARPAKGKAAPAASDEK